MLKSDIVSYIKIEKNNEFYEVVDSIIDAYQKYYDQTGDMFCYHIDMNLDYQLILYANKSDLVVTNLLNSIADNIQTHKKIKIFAKRVSINEIFIRFDIIGISIIVYNLVNDFDVLKKYQINNKNILYMHEVLHKNIFYESYNVLDYYLPKLNVIMNELTDNRIISKLKYNPNHKLLDNLKRFYFKHIKILKHMYSKNIVYVGADILKWFYGYGNISGNIAVVYTGNFNKLLISLGNKQMKKSDYEFRGKHIQIDDLIIYNGYMFSYPYHKFAGLYNIGTSPLLLKYIMLDSIFDNKYSIKIIKDIYSRIDFNKELITEFRSGYTIPPYYDYNKQIFGTKPWNRAHVLLPLKQ